ncbi:MAG: type IV secretion system DNA-binding domain-containing protein [Verrucomicrobiales bacterium]|nr:type IV secretion system DNA-binding domain-containing protein [Verrucomicrobiales bacterium]
MDWFRPGWLLGLFLACVFLPATLRALTGRHPRISASHLRGRALRRSREVQCQLAQRRPPHLGDDGLRFGPLTLPSRIATGHFAFVGATGSGKTLLQRLLMQSVLSEVRPGYNRRALVYDAKQDAVSVLAGMDLPCPVHILNPLDARSASWDMAADITCPASALQVASTLIPANQRDSNPFFSNAARHLLHGALLGFIKERPSEWTFRQLLLTVRDAGRLRKLLKAHELTAYLVSYFEPQATFQNILSTILTYTAPYEIIAAAWERSESRVSLRDWVEGESVLVLGNDEANRAAIDTINRLLFKRLAELILAQDEVPENALLPRRTWIFLDEVRQAGRLDGLSALMTKGRSKGAAVVLGFQDINGLRDVYGREAADELVGQCNTKAILRLNSPETAAWASQLFGSHEVVETRRSSNTNRNFRRLGVAAGSSSGESLTDDIAKRDAVLESEFFELPETSPENGLSGFFLSPLTGGFRDTIPGRWLSEHLCPPDPQVPNHVSRPEEHQYLMPWDSGTDDPAAPLPEEPLEVGFPLEEPPLPGPDFWTT